MQDHALAAYDGGLHKYLCLGHQTNLQTNWKWKNKIHLSSKSYMFPYLCSLLLSHRCRLSVCIYLSQHSMSLHNNRFAAFLYFYISKSKIFLYFVILQKSSNLIRCLDANHIANNCKYLTL